MTTTHGGDVLSAVSRYGGEADAYLDFSANINPLGPPDSVIDLLRERAADPRALMRYPDPYYRILREKLAFHTACAPDAIVVANGTAALLDAVIRAVQPASCLLPTPAFSEYRRALDAARSQTLCFPLQAEADFALDCEALRAELESLRPSLCIVTNPHNPSGALIPHEKLRTIVELTGSLGIPTILDEAFIDYVPEHSLTQIAPRSSHLVVLRSLTKFYAIPAMRVGYAVTSPALARAIAPHIPSWPVTTLAADAAAAALGNPLYEERTRSLNARERERLARRLGAISLRVWPSAANFLLVSTGNDDAAPLSANLARRGILVRDCSSYEGLEHGGYLRVAVRMHEENQRLIEALTNERLPA